MSQHRRARKIKGSSGERGIIVAQMKASSVHPATTDLHRPQLEQLISYVREGDTVVSQARDRLARNLDDLRKVVLGFTERGVHVCFEKENLSFTGEDSPMSQLLLSVMGAFAQFERDLIRERQREGIALAELREGAYMGRKHALSPVQAEQLRRRVAAGESKTALARELGISRQTLYRYAKPGTSGPGSMSNTYW